MLTPVSMLPCFQWGHRRPFMVWLADVGLIELFSTHFSSSFLDTAFSCSHPFHGSPNYSPSNMTGIGLSAASFSSGKRLSAGAPPPWGSRFYHCCDSVIHWIQVVHSPDTPGSSIHSKMQQTHGIQLLSAFIKASFSPIYPFLKGRAILIPCIPRLQWWAMLYCHMLLLMFVDAEMKERGGISFPNFTQIWVCMNPLFLINFNQFLPLFFFF